ncbi:DNA methylase [anaerobic digester metagenome]
MMIDPKTGKVYPANPNAVWRITKETFQDYYAAGRIVFPDDYDFLRISKPVLRYFKDDDALKGGDMFGYTSVSTLFPKEIGMTEDGSKDFFRLFENKAFSFPKPVNLINYLISISTIVDKDSLILDFFSGSATTAHAVMQLNAEDGGNRKYICVQIPEPTPEESEARKAGYATIPEIAKERIRRAGKKIMEEQKAKAEKEGGLFAEEEKKLDTGFKVFKLDSSNINAWDSDPDNLETALNNSLFNIKEDRNEDDLLYEILIKYGIELTEKINRHTIDGKTVYEMGAGSLIVCLADNLSTTVAEGIGKLYKEVSPEGIDGNCRVVFKETGFNGSDEVKTNTLLILKQHGITNVASV